MTPTVATASPAAPADALARAKACVAARQREGTPGMAVLSAGAGTCTVRIPLAGAASESLLAEVATAAGAAAAETVLPPERAALTVEFKVNIMAQFRGEALRASAHVVRAGKSITVCRVEVHGLAGGAETPCALCLMTLMAAHA